MLLLETQAEIIIAIVAINAGLLELVKASITGAILGNILLIFGLSIMTSGFKFKEQFFNKENVGMQASMLFLAVIGLTIPTILASTVPKCRRRIKSNKDSIFK